MTLHPRLLFGVFVGILSFCLLRTLDTTLQTAALGGWNLGAATYLIAIWQVYLTTNEEDVRARAARHDEPTLVILMLAGAAILASLTGVYFALHAARGAHGAAHNLPVALSAFTLASSWLVVQSLFIGHYTHRHFQVVAERGEGAGFLFPGDPPRSYLDFAYLAICVGATAQVSDPGVQSRALRNLVTAHALAAFVYNTAVLALGVNILSNLLGQ
ncbi:MAG TPA: DUF1345 domain-containing protein [Caulobacteraceae bacterium]|jgi:uncharacterized membrane protein|nr:DUF1345 domain-containing protein [Caulobacteraceae bacterium]